MSEKIIKPKALSLLNPIQVMEFGKTLSKYISDNQLSTTIQGKQYAHVAGWQFAGINFGLTAIVGSPKKVSTADQYIRTAYIQVERRGSKGNYLAEKILFSGFLNDEKSFLAATKGKEIYREEVKPYFAYECDCSIIRISGKTEVGKGVGFCSNLESAKNNFDEYAVNSMSQTRSIGKGYRNLIGFVMNSAGIEGTPAEEMKEVENRQEVIKKETKKDRSAIRLMNSAQFKKTLLKCNNGEIGDISIITESFYLTEDQKSAIKSVLKSKIKSND